jgi:predicted dehydrogenase
MSGPFFCSHPLEGVWQVDKRSRREFVLGVTAAAAAPLAAKAAAAPRATAPARKLGFAICGLGNLSEHQIAPALLKTEHCRLTGLITDSPDKARQWQAKYGIPAANVYSYDTMERLAHNRDIDVIYIVTPNAQHADQTLKAAAAGKHVICEKPMEVSVEKCQQMIDACKAAKVKLAVAYRCQFDANNLECVRIARDRELGALRLVEAQFNISVGEPGQWRLKHALSGGGALMDVGIYALQASRYLTGEEPILVSGIETKTDPVKFAEVDETMTWQAKFPSGAIALCTGSYNLPFAARFRGTTERGWFELDPGFSYDGNHGRRSDGKEIALPSGDPFAAEMDDFARCILEDRQSKVSGEEGLRDVRIMMAIYESARTGRAVKL